MTTRDEFFDDDGESGAWRLLRLGVPIAIFALIVFAVWYLVHSSTGVRREAPRLQTILATLPPPPPPPPKEKPPEIEKKIQEVPKPDEPKPTDAPKPMTINGPAQAGNDAFNIQAGDGGGNVLADTGGLGEATYSRYMGSAIEQMIQQDDRVNRLVFSAELAVWIDGAGRLTQAKILRSSGDPTTDDALLGALKEMPTLDQAPPGSLRFPQRIAVRGRRAG